MNDEIRDQIFDILNLFFVLLILFFLNNFVYYPKLILFVVWKVKKFTLRDKAVLFWNSETKLWFIIEKLSWWTIVHWNGEISNKKQQQLLNENLSGSKFQVVLLLLPIFIKIILFNQFFLNNLLPTSMQPRLKGIKFFLNSIILFDILNYIAHILSL